MKTIREFVPAYVDPYQGDRYTHVATLVQEDGSLVACFASGDRSPSIYKTVEEMLAAAERDFRERVRELPLGATGLGVY